MILILGLSIVVAGLVLLAEFLGNFNPKFDFLVIFKNKVSPFFGFILFFIGLTAFFAPSPTYFSIGVGENVAHVEGSVYRFIGDLIPALVAMSAGLIMESRILHFLKIPEASLLKINTVIMGFKRFWGWVCLIFGLVHLFLGNQLLL